MAAPLLVHFNAGPTGRWQITRLDAVRGDSLPAAAALDLGDNPGGATWSLKGIVSNVRYATAPEMKTLGSVQEGLGRRHATCAALIPIKKSDAWWALAQDERRWIFEEQSRHTARSLKYLPAVARRLHHSRDLGEPFDFLTWFEFAPEHASAFEDLVGDLRQSEEWRFVEREVDIRLTRGA